MSSPLVTKSEIHPVSFKLVKMGHPWITEDSFTKKFNQNSLFIEGFSKNRRSGLFLHDPKHKKVKGRFWGNESIRNFKDFQNQFQIRLTKSIEKRLKKEIASERDNFYLVFGEADALPGLFIQKIDSEILIQYYSYFWQAQESWSLKAIQEEIQKAFKIDLEKHNIWIQFRAEKAADQTPPRSLDEKTKVKKIIFKEFGVSYQAYFGESYDIGIYTDMSAVRANLKEYFKKSKRVLNLFSYTGAFSLYALKEGAEEVVSVDLSKVYLAWLEKNIELNHFSGHINQCTSTLNALKNYSEQKRKFDFIICDPPSSSNDGKKRTQALTDYEKSLPLMLSITEKGGHILLLLNTHQTSKDKFKAKISELIKNQSEFNIVQEVGLSHDCPTLKNFSEGNYLKGLVIKRYDHS